MVTISVGRKTFLSSRNPKRPYLPLPHTKTLSKEREKREREEREREEREGREKREKERRERRRRRRKTKKYRMRFGEGDEKSMK
jgi:hypothetical protein